jgi:hypothetical protein
MNKLNKEARISRVVARGEHSNHSHVVCGDDVAIRNADGNIMITVGNTGAVLRHILEDAWVNSGVETWTKEHTDIQLPPGEYRYVPQMEFNPLDAVVRRVKD